ncbi:MAG: hypothetical protein ACI89J_001456 [Hyphomicrobiaceae bacterium]
MNNQDFLVDLLYFVASGECGVQNSMSQAYPQFTPVQILEAGQRAFGEGRTDYAAQFFQHLIEHYAGTAEAATAHDTMARINGVVAAAPQAQPQRNDRAAPGTAPPAASSGPAPEYVQPPAANRTLHGVHLSVNGAAGHHNGHAQNGVSQNGYTPGGYVNGHTNGHANGHVNGHEANGYAASASGTDGQLRPMAQRPTEPSLGRAPLSPVPIDVPRHIARHNEEATLYQREPTPRPAATPQRMFVPAPEKNYIIGRVIAGLLLIIGIMGILAGIVLLYAAVTDPGIYAAAGLATPAQALIFSSSIFVGSIVALIASQMATALFDGADAAMDLARLERHKVGESDEA